MLSSPPKALLKLREALQEQRYSPTVVRNYCLYAGQFLSWLQANVNERSKLTRFQHLKLTHPMWRKAPRRAALI
ncbi:hypothetical protein PhaeoP97_03869 (plasmid) [Phaeobacter porticola]|uniref:Uncharacterized protein n=1 Tax=Phaeobacter porticola TaxID=1844006 RepID=A0A1L3IAI9_9RHOB|nr:hypothetical protein PhaeoP97_03869 [Phaeobacter porticola]